MKLTNSVLALIALNVLIALGTLLSCKAETSTPKGEPTKEKVLLEEFKGSYSADAPESTGVVEFEMVAKRSTVRLFEGREMEVWAYNEQVPGPILRVKLG